MSRIGQWMFRLRSVLHSQKIDSEMSEEVRLHIEMQTEANIAAGMEPREASDAAHRDFGGVDQVMERYRDERGMRWLDDCQRDIRQTLRGLLREKAFTLTVLAIVALCVAANVAIFTVVDGILLHPLPFPDSSGVFMVYNTYPKAGFDGGVSVPHYLERKQQVSAFAEAAAMRSNWVTLGGKDSTDRVESMLTTPSFFTLLRSNAVLGRTFLEDETSPGRSHVAVLSEDLWRGRFNADPAIVGQSILIDNIPHTVIGVMPGGFRYPSKHPMLWTPLVFTDEERTDLYRHVLQLDMIVRLRDRFTLAEAQAEIDGLTLRTLKRDPWAKMVTEGGFRAVVHGLQSQLVAGIRPILMLLQAGAIFLMLIGTVNLANLLLVRAVGRAREFSVRMALGAGTFRLGRALLLETLMLSVAGGLVGLGAGSAVLHATLSYFKDRLPFEVPEGLDAAVSATTLAATVLLGLALAIPVLWHSLRGNLAASLSSESRSGTTSRSVHRLRHALIVAQVASAFVLLAGTGLLALSMARVLAVDPGFNGDHVLTGMVYLPGFRYPDDKQRLSTVGRLIRELRGLPGVTSVGVDTLLPFTWSNGDAIAFRNHPLKPGEAAQPHTVVQVEGDLFPSLGIPLVEGRLINDGDVEAGRMVCVVDANFARRYWPRGDAIGGGITPDSGPNPEFFTIVGIVGTVRQNDLTDDRAYGTIYLPYMHGDNVMVALRTSQAPEAAGPDFRAAVARIDPALSVADMRTMAARVDSSLVGRRISLTLAAVFSGLALILASIGIYGVLAYSVAQRRREIGVRMALGAQPGQILRQFLLLGLRILAVGLPLGCAGAFLVTRSMAGFLYGVGPTNLPVLAATTAVLGAVAMLACLVPARRGSQVSPAEALRNS